MPELLGTIDSCSCQKCVGCCKRYPGWFSPTEAISAIKAGHARRMMRDWLEPCDEYGNEDRIYALAPAARGFGGKDCELSMHHLFSVGGPGRCMFLTKAEKCRLHDTGFKPEMCRAALHGGEGVGKEALAKKWDTPLGAPAP